MKKIRCNSNPADFLAVSVSAGCAYIDAQQGDESTEIELSPDKIRKLRKQLKRALIKIEGDNGPKDTTRKADDLAVVDKDEAWIPKPGDSVKFVDETTLDVFDKYVWHPKVGEIYVVRHVYDDSMYAGFSLTETPDEKFTRLPHGYKFRSSGFEPVA